MVCSRRGWDIAQRRRHICSVSLHRRAHSAPFALLGSLFLFPQLFGSLLRNPIDPPFRSCLVGLLLSTLGRILVLLGFVLLALLFLLRITRTAPG
jgi:hypothetical protein